MGRPDIQHEPVLCQPLMSLVAPRAGETVVDTTVGHGGHALLLTEAIGEKGHLIAFDIDENNLNRSRMRLEEARGTKNGPRLDFLRANFAELEQHLDELGISQADIILADLGVSTDQILDSSRGLSFAEDGPLDMRLDDRLDTTAADLVNRLGESELANLIYDHSQEHFSRRIAKRICQARREKRITTVAQLVKLVCSAMGVPPHGHRSRIHPATRTFLSLRIIVNHEVENLKSLLSAAPRRLKAGGRLAIISFHSGEDRLVKQGLLDWQRQGVYEIITKKPVQASSEEQKQNPRARSAKLRVAVRTTAPGSAV